MTIDEIAAITEPSVRAKAAAAYAAAALSTVERVHTIRDDAVAQMLRDGWSVRKVAAEVGLSPARVQQIKTTATPQGVPSTGWEGTSDERR